MKRISEGTFIRAKGNPLGFLNYTSYGNSAFCRSLELVLINNTGFLCYYDSTSFNKEEEFFKGSAAEAEAEFLDFDRFADEYYQQNKTVAGGY